MKKFTSLLVLFFLFSGFLMAQTTCADLFFSEYVEGSGNNKVLEIYNPTDQPVDLSLYVIKRYSNGSPVPTEELPLSGTVVPGDVFVVTNGQTDSVWVPGGGYWSLPIEPLFYARGDFHCSGIYPAPMYFNGDDAMTLEKVTGQVVDIFAKTGDDPGNNGWNDIPPTYYAGDQYWTSWTKDQTLIRKPEIRDGVKVNPAIFKVDVEWDSVAKNTYDSLGFHRCDCHTGPVIGWGINDYQAVHTIVLYPNPVTSQQLTLDADAPVREVTLVNLIGQLVFKQKFEGSTKRLTLKFPELQTGIYTIRVVFADESTSQHKVVLK